MDRVSAEGDGRRGSRPPGTGIWTFLLAAVTAGALVHVAVRFEGLEVAYALGHARKEGAELEEQRRRLQIEIGMLKDPNRVVSIARDTLKMGPPPPEAIRRVGTGGLFPEPARVGVKTGGPHPAAPASPAPTSPSTPRDRVTAGGAR